MDRFREITAFKAVVEQGSFVAAGDALRLSKAAVSRAVQELEDRLGARLLHRTTRRLSLTEAGQAYYDRSCDILASLEEADSAVGSVTGQALGKLRINAPVSFGINHLAGLWGQFSQQYPEVNLDIDLSDRFVDVVEEGFDAVIRIGDLTDSSLVQRRLAGTQLVTCASPAYLKAHGKPSSPEALPKHSLIGYQFSLSRDIWRYEAAGRSIDIPTQPTFRTNNGDTCRALALAGRGIIQQPDFLLHHDLANGDLIPLFPHLQERVIGIYLVFPSRRFLSVKVRGLVDFLVEAFRKPPWENSQTVT